WRFAQLAWWLDTARARSESVPSRGPLIYDAPALCYPWAQISEGDYYDTSLRPSMESSAVSLNPIGVRNLVRGPSTDFLAMCLRDSPGAQLITIGVHPAMRLQVPGCGIRYSLGPQRFQPDNSSAATMLRQESRQMLRDDCRPSGLVDILLTPR